MKMPERGSEVWQSIRVLSMRYEYEVKLMNTELLRWVMLSWSCKGQA